MVNMMKKCIAILYLFKAKTFNIKINYITITVINYQ